MSRKNLDRARSGRTVSFRVGGAEGYLTTAEFPDGSLSDIYIMLGKVGSTMRGMVDSLARSVSLGLQAGVPLETYVADMVNTQFEPQGLTDDSELSMVTSLNDYIFRRLALDYLPADVCAQLGVRGPEGEEADLSNVIELDAHRKVA